MNYFIVACTYWLKLTHLGGKLNLHPVLSKWPSPSYNIIIFSTKGYQTRWNSKIMILFDQFARGIHDMASIMGISFGKLKLHIDKKLFGLND